MANDNVDLTRSDVRSESPLAGNMNDRPAFQPSKPVRYAYVCGAVMKNSSSHACFASCIQIHPVIKRFDG